MRTVADIARDLHHAVRDGGATVPTHHGGRVPDGGYVVAVANSPETVISGPVRADDVNGWRTRLPIEAWVRANRARLGWESYAGAWLDDDGRLVLDIVEVDPEAHSAVLRAIVRGEHSIYDLTNGREIVVGADLSH